MTQFNLLRKQRQAGDSERLRNKFILANKILIYPLVLILVFILALACYGIFDNFLIYEGADKAHYSDYEPTRYHSEALDKLREINPEVIGWLKINNTCINYPVVRHDDNDYYLNHNALKEECITGAIFMDKDNDVSLGDFNTVIHGHHMDKNKMFGSLDKFLDHNYFNAHRSGFFFHDDTYYPIKVIACMKVNAYDFKVFGRLNGIGEAAAKKYMSYIKKKSVQFRSTSIGASDHLLILNTCGDKIDDRIVVVCKLGKPDKTKLSKDIKKKVKDE